MSKTKFPRLYKTIFSKHIDQDKISKTKTKFSRHNVQDKIIKTKSPKLNVQNKMSKTKWGPTVATTNLTVNLLEVTKLSTTGPQ